MVPHILEHFFLPDWSQAIYICTDSPCIGLQNMKIKLFRRAVDVLRELKSSAKIIACGLAVYSSIVSLVPSRKRVRKRS